ncbi:hypothetical protein ACFQ0B_32470 [Nonomuraea thailandensis]
MDESVDADLPGRGDAATLLDRRHAGDRPARHAYAGDSGSAAAGTDTAIPGAGNPASRETDREPVTGVRGAATPRDRREPPSRAGGRSCARASRAGDRRPFMRGAAAP